MRRHPLVAVRTGQGVQSCSVASVQAQPSRSGAGQSGVEDAGASGQRPSALDALRGFQSGTKAVEHAVSVWC